MTEDEKNDKKTMMAQKIAMAYITASIANGYLEDAWSDMKDLGTLKHDVKRRASYTRSYFDNFNQSLKWFLSAKGNDEFNNAITEDYEVLQETCDKFMKAGIRLTAFQYDNNDEVRADGEYLCRVEGVAKTEKMVMLWKNKQWLSYSLTSVSDGWTPIKVGVRVVEVLERLH